jgi:hypothetical protein
MCNEVPLVGQVRENPRLNLFHTGWHRTGAMVLELLILAHHFAQPSCHLFK